MQTFALTARLGRRLNIILFIRRQKCTFCRLELPVPDSSQAVWGRLQPCSLHPFSPGSPLPHPKSPSLLSVPNSPCPPWSCVPSQPLRGIFSLNSLMDIAGGRWADTQTPFPGNQPENPQVGSQTLVSPSSSVREGFRESVCEI